MRSGKRIVSVIQEGSDTEIQWGSEEPAEGRIEGYVQIDSEGRLIVPFRNEQDEPFVFVLGGAATGIYATEDAVAEHDAELLVWRAQ